MEPPRTSSAYGPRIPLCGENPRPLTSTRARSFSSGEDIKRAKEANIVLNTFLLFDPHIKTILFDSHFLSLLYGAAWYSVPLNLNYWKKGACCKGRRQLSLLINFSELFITEKHHLYELLCLILVILISCNRKGFTLLLETIMWCFTWDTVSCSYLIQSSIVLYRNF